MELGRAGLAWVAVLLVAALGAQAAAAAAGDFDPYRVLGVGRSSSQADIKKAYKRLAREWYVPAFRLGLPLGSGPLRTHGGGGRQTQTHTHGAVSRPLGCRS